MICDNSIWESCLFLMVFFFFFFFFQAFLCTSMDSWSFYCILYRFNPILLYIFAQMTVASKLMYSNLTPMQQFQGMGFMGSVLDHKSSAFMNGLILLSKGLAGVTAFWGQCFLLWKMLCSMCHLGSIEMGS